VTAHVAETNPHTQYARHAVAQTYTAQQTFQIATLTDGATIAWDGATQQIARVTLGGARAIAAMTNAVAGGYYELTIHQDATGSRIPTWANSGVGSYDWGTAGIPTLTTTANRADTLAFKALDVGGTLKLRFLGIAKGFA
jgi:hypothetical protein